MKYHLTGVSTPFGGLSWEKAETEKERIEFLFFYLESKRILTNPIYMELVSQCVESVLEIRATLVETTKGINFSEEVLNQIRQMIQACNLFLDAMNTIDENLIYKLHDHWENLLFDSAMKKFRKQFKEAISMIEDAEKVTFKGIISEKY